MLAISVPAGICKKPLFLFFMFPEIKIKNKALLTGKTYYQHIPVKNGFTVIFLNVFTNRKIIQTSVLMASSLRRNHFIYIANIIFSFLRSYPKKNLKNPAQKK